MRRRFRLKRRRLAGFALLPAALIITAGAVGSVAPAKQAGIDSGKKTVTYGHKVGLHGTFPGAKRKKVDISFRKAGSKNSRVVQHTKTGGHGFYGTHIKPLKSGFWRATLSTKNGKVQKSASGKAIDNRTGKERVKVRSKTRSRVGSDAMVGKSVKVKGRVRPGDANRLVTVRTDGAKKKTRTNSHGRFSVRLPANKLGSHKVRVKTRGTGVAKGSHDRAGKFTVYRNAVASWYGPGLYGNHVACGGTLQPGTIGVANKTLPCGTKVKFRYHGRSVTAPVIDRGPYSGNREYDLTEATKNKLHFPGVATLQASK